MPHRTDESIDLAHLHSDMEIAGRANNCQKGVPERSPISAQTAGWRLCGLRTTITPEIGDSLKVVARQRLQPRHRGGA
jgi:hypothetical protein